MAETITIRKDGEQIGEIECYSNGTFMTTGMIGEGNEYPNFKSLLLGLQGFSIEMDDLFF